MTEQHIAILRRQVEQARADDLMSVGLSANVLAALLEERAELRAVISQAHALVMETYTPEDATPLHESLLELLSGALREAQP